MFFVMKLPCCDCCCCDDGIGIGPDCGCCGVCGGCGPDGGCAPDGACVWIGGCECCGFAWDWCVEFGAIGGTERCGGP